MLEQAITFIENTSTSPHAAIVISLALNIAFAWGWWRREQSHNTRYDNLHGEWIRREEAYLECLNERDDEVSAIGHEAFTALQEVAVAMVGMERTLDGLENLMHLAMQHGFKGDNQSEE